MSFSSTKLIDMYTLAAILDRPDSVYATFGDHPNVKLFMNGIVQNSPHHHLVVTRLDNLTYRDL